MKTDVFFFFRFASESIELGIVGFIENSKCVENVVVYSAKFGISWLRKIYERAFVTKRSVSCDPAAQFWATKLIMNWRTVKNRSLTSLCRMLQA